MSKRKKVNVGDLFSLKSDSGFIILQFYNIGVSDIEMVKIFENIYKKIPDNLDVLLKEDFFLVQFLLKYAFKLKEIKKIGHLGLKKNPVPKYMRTYSIHDDYKWSIVEVETLKRKNTNKLTSKEKKLSPYGVWNLEYIRQKMENGFKLSEWV